MHHLIRRTTFLAALGLLGTVLFAVACSNTPVQPVSTRVSTLKAQVDDLDRELGMIHAARGDEQQALMHQYWDMLQKQLQYVHNLPGVQARDCTDWTVLDPKVTGHSPSWGSRPCPALHDDGPAAGFPYPSELSPMLFELMMRQQLAVLTAQVKSIETEPNATARLDLMRQHYETRYRYLQTVLGRDWMWAGEPALPDPSSMGAVLFSQYCGQCHNPPPPGLNTPAGWRYVTQRMSTIIERQAHSGEMGVNLPSADEFQAIAQYLMANSGRR